MFKNEQDALECFCKAFELKIASMAYDTVEGGYLARLRPDGTSPYESEIYCYVGMRKSGEAWIRLQDFIDYGDAMSIPEAINREREIFLSEGWKNISGKWE